MPAYCKFPPVSGMCLAYMPSFFYNATSGMCESFVYGGCGGNDNRFTSVDECMKTCGQFVCLFVWNYVVTNLQHNS